MNSTTSTGPSTYCDRFYEPGLVAALEVGAEPAHPRDDLAVVGDAGEIWVRGEKVRFRSVVEAADHGVLHLTPRFEVSE